MKKDKKKEKDPEWEYVLPRLERAEKDILFNSDDADLISWNAGDAIFPPQGFDDIVTGGGRSGLLLLGEKEKRQLSGRILVDVDAGKMLVGCADSSVYPLWFSSSLRGPCVPQQLALGLGSSLLEPSTVIVVDSRRKELVKGKNEVEEGFAKLLADVRNAGMHGGAVVVIDVDDLVGVIKDSSRTGIKFQLLSSG